MSINLSVLGQRVQTLVGQLGDRLDGDANRKASSAFVVECVRTLFDLDPDEALEWLVDGGGDAGIDAMDVGEPRDGEFTVTLLQAKYKQRDDGESAFPANSIQRLVGTVGALFDPYKLLEMNDTIAPKIEEIRSLVADGNIPRVHVLLCNNGRRWNDEGDFHITNARFGDQVRWEHINHDRLISLLQRQKPVSDRLSLAGKAIVEDFQFTRVLVGRMSVTEVAALMDRHGDRLLERNIRRYLGLSDSRVNAAIRTTLLDASQNPFFYFFNNGVTMVCSKFAHNALQADNYSVQVEDLQIINGGQTCKTLQQTLRDGLPGMVDFSKAYVLVRLYQLPEDAPNIVQRITYATNSQNPVDLRDLRANDEIQQKLELALKELDYTYKRKRDQHTADTATITSSVAAEAIFAIWRRQPHTAKFYRRTLFNQHYDDIFIDSLNAAQVAVATLLFRVAENERKRPSTTTQDKRYRSYAAHFLAMLMGEELLRRAGLNLDDLKPSRFTQVRKLLEDERADILSAAVRRLDSALAKLALDGPDVSLQRLSAAFRRGDLLAALR